MSNKIKTAGKELLGKISQLSPIHLPTKNPPAIPAININSIIINVHLAKGADIMEDKEKEIKGNNVNIQADKNSGTVIGVNNNYGRIIQHIKNPDELSTETQAEL